LRGLALFVLAGMCATAVPSAAQEARPIRALYVTGGGFHDFTAQKQTVPPGIAARTNIVWTIDHTADTSTSMLRSARSTDTRPGRYRGLPISRSRYRPVPEP